LQLLSKRLDAKHIYEKTIGREFVDAQDANIIDNKGFVSAAGYGEGSCLITIGKNEKEKVVAIKITY